MLKLEHAFHTVAAGAAAFLFAGPAAASTYTMQDYYNALAAVESDYWQIGSLEAEIASARNQIDSNNFYYQWQYQQCSGIGTAGAPGGSPNWYAIQDCQDSIAAEWSMVISGFEADIIGYELGLFAMYPVLSNDQALLAAIKADLGIE